MKRYAMASALALFLALPAAAQPEDDERAVVLHQVRRGDSLELLAAEFYGNRQFAVFIMVANGMTHPRPLKATEVLRIPTAWKYRAVEGESMAELAERFLGDRRRATYLADFNAMPADALLLDGQEVTVPFHVVHTAADRESLGSIAATFYGDSTRAELLRGYNFRPNARPLRRGESLIVPIVHVRVREAKLPQADAEARAREEKAREETKRAREALPRARTAWEAGDYATVKRNLAALDLDLLEPELAADAGFLLGSAYVAFGDEDSAFAQFKQVLGHKPDFVVRADLVSPKIRRVWERAGGKSLEP